MTSREKMVEARRLLREVKNSGYWPYASPAPCSTEVKIKENIDTAIERIDNAIFWHDEMFGKTGRPDDKCVGTKIVEK